ncbi:MAG: tRNA guanosine(34) transglycosylase Tgt [Patescibacteria group bacterium]|nr:tRNA guanosine(34) transglycosylase Tgt [Patescibacteria group bacterium]
MISFKITKKSKKSNARVGVLSTPHGSIETPSYVNVATQAVVKTFTSEDIKACGGQMLIANTYHLHIRPGEEALKKHGGIHQFMNWQGPIMTDSGGFQVFSLGFGKDYGTGKILKQKSDQKIIHGAQPKAVKITEDGVEFRSYVDGRKLFLGPKESIQIQEKIGADIIFAFDECTSPLADHEYNARALERTQRWLQTCIKTKKSNQALYGIVQGGKYKDLRIASARYTAAQAVDGFGIGGEFGDSTTTMKSMLRTVLKELPENKPRHLLGIGHLKDIETIIKEGVDTFDCITPTHYARHGYAFTQVKSSKLKVESEIQWIKLNLNDKRYLLSKEPIDKNCNCFTCQHYSRGYLHHLLRAYEITPLRLLTIHNVHAFNEYVATLRNYIKKGLL